MSVDIEYVKRLTAEHFTKLMHLQRIADMHISVIQVLPITAGTDLHVLADRYIDDFFHCAFDKEYNFDGFRKLKGSSEQRTEFKNRIVLPQVVNAESFVSSIIRYRGQTQICHSLIRSNATVANTSEIIDPFTGSYILKPEVSLVRGSKTRTIRFNNGFGNLAATYIVFVDATCAGCRVRTCDGYASGNDSTPGMSAHVNFKKSIQNDCCVVDYAFAGTGGWPDVEIKWSGAKSKFEIKVGGWGWSYFEEAGSLSDCCCPDAETFTGMTTSMSSSSVSSVSSEDEVPEIEVTCASIFPTLPPCDSDDGYDLTWEELLEKVRESEGLDGNHPLRSERELQNDEGDYPEVGYHYNFYDDRNHGKHVGGGFGVQCCRDTEAGPQRSWKYKWTA